MEPSQIYEEKTASVLLITASLILMATAIFNVSQLSIDYGLGAGAILQSSHDNAAVAPALQATSAQLQAIYQAMLEEGFLAAVGLMMFIMAFVLLVHGPNKYESYTRRYVPLHLMLAVIYVALILIIDSTFSSSIYTVNLVTYVAIAVCMLLDIYLQLSLHNPAMVRKIRGIGINPSTPYANLVRIKEELFDNLNGEVGIVDKHFNSLAMSNLYRLLPTEGSGIKSLRVLTSEEMLDSGFGSNYADLKNELKNQGIGMEIKIMAKDDASAQHERFIFDDSVAYKIPPLNIINRKSEHIVKMGQRDARRRFDYLYQNAVKFENLSSRHDGASGGKVISP